jgi:hypothetical protein
MKNSSSKDRGEMIETYKGVEIFKSDTCHLVTLGGKIKYFFSGADKKAQLERCKKEIDNFKAGKIK